MHEPRTESSNAILEGEWLVAMVADEAEHQNLRGQVGGEALDELIAAIERVRRDAQFSAGFQDMLVVDLLEAGGLGGRPPFPFRAAAAIIFGSALALWAVLGLLVFAGFQYFAS
jgi:hypothetical protein